ncbi:MAG: FAD-dependent oxidoreductase [Brachybacterium sp.]|uniref:FAD-dependent oxidoreductase n=1 Tax=Brachybacterium sp. AOP35-5H-19 TaxID=3457685 RepID=UPI003FBA46A0
MALDHAIIMGGGIAGLLSAAGLAEHVERVTIIDRDELCTDGPEALAPRRGVPQGGVVHRLLALGETTMEELLPGLRQELLAAGCQEWIRDSQEHLQEPGTLALTRPVLEGVLRRRVLALPTVTVRQAAVAGLLTENEGRRVTGVTVRGGDAGELHGDLVVDAAGRSSRAAGWVEGLGAGRPRALSTRVHVAYTCLRLRLREGALPEGVQDLVVPASAELPLTVELEPCGNGEHILSVSGTSRNLPPTDLAGLRELVPQLHDQRIAAALEGAEAVGEPAAAKAAGSHRLRWEEALEAPEGLVHVGDAAAAFTPLYAQGMTMAAVGAATLRDAVRAGELAPGFAAEYHRALASRLDPAWDSAVARDAAIPGAELDLDTPVPTA